MVLVRVRLPLQSSSKSNQMQVFRINTTAYEEEDFYLLTDLTEQDIVEVINPLVMQERDGYEEYDNDILLNALKKRFHKAKIFMFTDFETITF
jgi:hypothetical protein